MNPQHKKIAEIIKMSSKFESNPTDFLSRKLSELLCKTKEEIFQFLKTAGVEEQ